MHYKFIADSLYCRNGIGQFAGPDADNEGVVSKIRLHGCRAEQNRDLLLDSPILASLTESLSPLHCCCARTAMWMAPPLGWAVTLVSPKPETQGPWPRGLAPCGLNAT